ncbi:RHTO0S06e08108g1_1 [Rhodotorula toruloides]|uniref:RHTO0S06e08108g1_1 n=2 Tax=Rhodotorula toruloides TaxID=5286 RepID=A0A061B4K1_RHOTO|nr:uncharacterized protein RHTO_06346 [Rhodotorula toruloides NP11]EMS24342.1 hypothetical protein RHTO_06346 [Rhodotorula toruloides NP11]CDR41947.1 RHTO0S06e08108g1_1 [Rhodotorula toruloides]
MSASLARTLFRPTTATATTTKRVCPASRFFPSGSASRSARTADAVAHITVAAALVASTASFLSHPDTLFFDHPPRSAISWVPARHIALRDHSSSPSMTSSISAGPLPSLSPAPRPTTSNTGTSVLKGMGTQAELRLAGVIGRGLF